MFLLSHIVAYADTFLEDWRESKAVLQRVQHHSNSHGVFASKWEKSRAGWLKCNVDASVSKTGILKRDKKKVPLDKPPQHLNEQPSQLIEGNLTLKRTIKISKTVVVGTQCHFPPCLWRL